MRALVAATQNEQETREIINGMYASGANILWVDVIEGTKLTIVYETQQKVTNRLEKEWQDAIAAAEEATKKQRKQPTLKTLHAKAEKLCLFNVAIERNGQEWQIINNYGKNEILYSCKTPTGISRKLTAMYWEKAIKSLRNHELIK